MSKSASTRVLVIAAHPDDEVLGCGGTIARLAADGVRVGIRILGEGWTARDARRTRHRRARQLQALRRDAAAAARLMGVSDLAFDALPDNRFDTVDDLDIIKRVERWVHAFKPDVIYTHHPGDLNVDHRATFRAVLTATRPLPGCSVRELYAFEIASSTEWSFQRLGRPFQPNVFLDISQTIEAKIRAMERYRNEVRTSPHPRSAEVLRANAQRWGSVVGAKYAEAFELIRGLR